MKDMNTIIHIFPVHLRDDSSLAAALCECHKLRPFSTYLGKTASNMMKLSSSSITGLQERSMFHTTKTTPLFSGIWSWNPGSLFFSSCRPAVSDTQTCINMLATPSFEAPAVEIYPAHRSSSSLSVRVEITESKPDTLQSLVAALTVISFRRQCLKNSWTWWRKLILSYMK